MVPAITKITITVRNLVTRERIGATNRLAVVAKALVKWWKRMFGFVVWFMYMKVRTRPFPVSSPFVCSPPAHMRGRP